MCPPDDALAYKDAVFLSPHKFIGGPGTPGILAVRRSLCTNRVPTMPGGGTVTYVTAIRGLQTFRRFHACPGCFRLSVGWAGLARAIRWIRMSGRRC